MRRGRAAVLMVILAMLSGACAGTEPESEVSLEIQGAPSFVEGNVISLPVSTQNFDIVAADGDTSGESGHYHVFIDREPVDVGEAIPKEAGVVHSAESPVKLYGMSVGEHKLTVVLGDGTHKRVGEDIQPSVTVDVRGPSVHGSAPATLDEGKGLEVSLESEDVEIVKPDGDESGKTGHYHVLVDPKNPPKAGETIPAPEEGKVYHSPEDKVTVEGLEKGEHTLWIVLGDGLHNAFKPAVMDKLVVTVT
jgi:hypothetical protein